MVANSSKSLVISSDTISYSMYLKTVEQNIANVELGTGSSVSVRELDWDADLPAWCAEAKIDLVLAADCTYNADSRYVPFSNSIEVIESC